MSAQPSAAVKTASGKLGKFQKGIGKKAELVVTPVRISGAFASWMSLGSAPLRLGREMVGWEQLQRRTRKKVTNFWWGLLNWETSGGKKDDWGVIEVWKVMTGSVKGTNEMTGDRFRTSERRGFFLQGVKFLDSESFVH